MKLPVIPVVQKCIKKMTRKKPNVTVNLDEVVVLGATVKKDVHPLP